MLNFRYMEYALALAEFGSFKRAALEMNISQPALSKGIAALEESYGHRLFERGVNPIRPTETGRLVLEEARRRREGDRELREHILRLHGVVHGSLRIAFGPYAGAVFAPRFALAFHQRFPDSILHLQTRGWSDPPRLLRNRQIDLFAADIESPELRKEFDCFDLPNESTALFCHPNHPLARMPHPGLADVYQYPLVLCDAPEWGKRWLRSQMPDRDPRESPAVIRVNDYRLIRDILQGGVHVTLGFPSFFEPDLDTGALVEIPLENAPASRAGVAVRKAEIRTPELQGALEILHALGDMSLDPGDRQTV